MSLMGDIGTSHHFEKLDNRLNPTFSSSNCSGVNEVEQSLQDLINSIKISISPIDPTTSPTYTDNKIDESSIGKCARNQSILVLYTLYSILLLVT